MVAARQRWEFGESQAGDKSTDVILRPNLSSQRTWLPVSIQVPYGHKLPQIAKDLMEHML